MRKTLLNTLLFIFLFSVTQVVSARQGQNLSFTLQTITIKGQQAYDMQVSPDGRIAAIYIGPTASVLLNIAPFEYSVIEALLPIRLIDLTTGNELGQLIGSTDYITDTVFSPDGKQFISSHKNGDIIIWDVASKRLIKRLMGPLQPSGIRLLADGKTLVVQQGNGILYNFFVWDLELENITKVIHTPLKSAGQVKTQLPDSADYQYPIFDISPDGKLMATANLNGEVALWDTDTLNQTILQKPEKKEVHINVQRVRFSPDGKTLIYFDRDTTQTHFWDVDSRKETKVLTVGDIHWGLSASNDLFAWVAHRKELWFTKVDQPNLATKVMDFPDNLLVGNPTITFISGGNQMVVGGFGLKGSGNNVVYVISFKN